MENTLLRAVKIIPAPNELLAIFTTDPEAIKPLLEKQSKEGYTIMATEYGLDIEFNIARLSIAIPFALFDHLLQWPNLVLFFANEDDYIPVALYTITIEKQVIEKAKEILVP